MTTAPAMRVIYITHASHTHSRTSPTDTHGGIAALLAGIRADGVWTQTPYAWHAFPVRHCRQTSGWVCKAVLSPRTLPYHLEQRHRESIQTAYRCGGSTGWAVADVSSRNRSRRCAKTVQFPVKLRLTKAGASTSEPHYTCFPWRKTQPSQTVYRLYLTGQMFYDLIFRYRRISRGRVWVTLHDWW